MELLKLCPDLEERILASSEEEVGLIADLVSFYRRRIFDPAHALYEHR
jgi:hypothetical protein